MIIVRIVQFVKIVQLVQLDYYGYIKFFGVFVGTWVGAFTKKLLREADKSRIKNQPRTVIVQRLILFNVIHANVYVGNI